MAGKGVFMKKIVASILIASVVVFGLSAKSLKDLAKKALGTSDTAEEKNQTADLLKVKTRCTFSLRRQKQI